MCAVCDKWSDERWKDGESERESKRGTEVMLRFKLHRQSHLNGCNDVK